VPLEVTHTALVTENIIKKILEMDSKFSKFIVELLLYFKKSYSELFQVFYLIEIESLMILLYMVFFKI
jgi:inosine-uridine nucleoside N-ribohydrolase